MTISETPILKFESVTVSGGRGFDTGLWNASLVIAPGELTLVRVEASQPRLPFADLATGLTEPSRGAVEFDGVPWSGLGPGQAAEARAWIGHAPDSGGWLARLSVEENLTLSERFHSRRDVREIREQAERMCRAFGLPGVPRGLPHRVMGQDLARAGLVRAFLGAPRLVILERPAQGVGLDMLPILVNTVRDARSRGAGVLWLTSERRIFIEPGVRPSRRYRMSGSQLLHVGDGA